LLTKQTFAVEATKKKVLFKEKRNLLTKQQKKKYQANVCRHLLTKQIVADEAGIALVRATH